MSSETHLGLRCACMLMLVLKRDPTCFLKWENMFLRKWMPRVTQFRFLRTHLFLTDAFL